MNGYNKYRAWDKEDKRMIIHEQDFLPLKVTNIGVFKLDPQSQEERWILIPPVRFDIMLISDMADKRGNLFSQGDILGLEDPEDMSRCVVVYKEGGLKRSYLPFHSNNKKNNHDYYEKDYIHGFDWWDLQNWVVIGNIYENPELIVLSDE